MIKHKYPIILISAILLLFLAGGRSCGDEYIKSVEITNAKIKFDHQQLPPIAYLKMSLTNNGDQKILNATLEITYYDSSDYVIHKVFIKNALNKPVLQKETQSYKIWLSGKFMNEKNEQYPYSKREKVDKFDVKIAKIKYKKGFWPGKGN